MKKERPNIDQALCNHVMFLIKGGARTTMTAEMLGIGKSTVQKIQQADFSAEKYAALKQQEKERMARAAQVETSKEKERNKQAFERDGIRMVTFADKREALAEEQCPGQLQMELPVKKETDEPERIRWMKFIAAQVDKMIFQQAQQYDLVHMELDRINDTLSQLVRAIRKE